MSHLPGRVMGEHGDLITIGKIERPFGVRGDVRVRSLSDVPGRFEGLERVTLVTASGQRMEASVRRRRRVHGAYILGLDVFASPEDASKFSGALVTIPRDAASVDPPPGQYYAYQLIGLTVVDESGETLGCVREIVETRGNHVLVIEGEKGEHLLPATKTVVQSVDLREGRINVRWAGVFGEGADAV